MVRKCQSSLIEVLLVSVCISGCLTFLLLSQDSGVESLRVSRIEAEEVLISYLNYKASSGESFSFLLSNLCVNESLLGEGSYLFNESISVIESLNNNNSFILFIDSLSDVVLYNRQKSVCLSDVQLAVYDLSGPCNGRIMYGSWFGEAKEVC